MEIQRSSDHLASQNTQETGPIEQRSGRFSFGIGKSLLSVVSNAFASIKLAFSPHTKSAPIALPRPNKAVANVLSDCLAALEMYKEKHSECQIDPKTLSETKYTSCKQVRKAFDKLLPKTEKKEFSLKALGKGSLKTYGKNGSNAEFGRAVHMARSQRIANEPLERNFTVGDITGKEKVDRLSTSLSQAFLELVGGHENHVAFMETAVLRNSQMIKEKNAQAMLTNPRRHEITVDGKTTSILRFGAPAIHAKRPYKAKASLHDLQKMHTALKIKIQGAPQKKKASLQKEMTKLETELKERETLLMSQGLTMIQGALEDLTRDPAKMAIVEKAGCLPISMLSLLSDIDLPGESDHHTNGDAWGTANALSNNLVINFSTTHGDSPSIARNDEGKWVITCKGPEDLSDIKPKVLFASHGINHLQNTAEMRDALHLSSDHQQERSAKEAIAGLKELYQEIGDPPELEAKLARLEELAGSSHSLEFIQLYEDVSAHLCTSQCIMCKSGKDRTAMGATDTLARRITTDEDTQKKLMEDLLGGCSFEITGQNSGEENKYAFGKKAHRALPGFWHKIGGQFMKHSIGGNVDS